jgi:hypothetical protein
LPRGGQHLVRGGRRRHGKHDVVHEFRRSPRRTVFPLKSSGKCSDMWRSSEFSVSEGRAYPPISAFFPALARPAIRIDSSRMHQARSSGQP